MVSGSAIYSIDYTEFLLANSKSCKVLSSYLEGILPRVESSDGEAVTEGLGELELRAVGALEAVSGRVEL